MDWLAGLIGITAKIIVGRKNKWGWIIYAISELIWIIVGLSTRLYGLVIVSGIVFFIYIYNFFRWRKDKSICSCFNGEFMSGDKMELNLPEKIDKYFYVYETENDITYIKSNWQATFGITKSECERNEDISLILELKAIEALRELKNSIDKAIGEIKNA